MTRSSLPGIVVTDLDGTLLDHHTYDFSPAAPALEALGRLGVPLVLCSSKTREELLEVQRTLGIRGPFIAENGGAAFLTGGGALEPLFPERMAGLPARSFGAPYDRLRAALKELRTARGLPLRGFGDATIEEIARWTDLSPDDARRAAAREFDEPFLWIPEPDPREVRAAARWLQERRLRLTRGGRFWHLLGENDKGRAVRWLLDAVRNREGAAVPSLGLGDSENDFSFLGEVDEGVLVERPGGGHAEPHPAGLSAAEGVGPAGWCRAVLRWLGRLEP